MDGAATAYKSYLAGGKTFRFAQQLRRHNDRITDYLQQARNHLSPALQADADALLHHLQVWTRKWDALALEINPSPDDLFVFENEVTFPRTSAGNLVDYTRSLD